tara:strand:- start:362669 stop:364168 length:1500 start_codon:yes stop_codon:yes gene_type:complete
MNKKELTPLVVHKAIEPYVDKKDGLFKRVSSDKDLIRFKGSSIDSNFFFHIKSHRKQGNQNLILLEYQPFTAESVESRASWVKSDQKSIDTHFQIWFKLLSEFKSTKSVFDDPIEKGFQEDYYSYFEIIEEEKDKPLEPSSILPLYEHFEEIRLKLDEYKNEENTHEIENIQEEINDLNKNLTVSGRQEIANRICLVWAKLTKLGIKYIKEFVEVSRKYVMKEAAKRAFRRYASYTNHYTIFKNRRLKIIYSVLSFLILSGCNWGYEVHEVYEQKIKNSDKSIFKYSALSNINSGAKYGYEILEENEEIGIRSAKQLPFHFFSRMPTKDTISIISFQKGRYGQPEYISTVYDQVKGFIVETTKYKWRDGIPCRLDYGFSKFKETADSLIFYGISKIHHRAPTESNKIGFLKGNVILIESDSVHGKVARIKVKGFLAKEHIDGLLDRHTILKNDSLKISGLIHFEFIPDHELRINDFSDIGIFKPRKIRDRNKIKNNRQQ